MYGTIEKLKKLIEEEKQEAQKLAPDAIIHEYIPILEDALSALETTQRKRILTGLGLLNKGKKR
jgi:molecular chaperone GrpE (heat shock protein)